MEKRYKKIISQLNHLISLELKRNRVKNSLNFKAFHMNRNEKNIYNWHQCK
jgi:hypothetical protein